VVRGRGVLFLRQVLQQQNRQKRVLLALLLCGFLIGLWRLRRYQERMELQERKRILSHPLSYDIPPFISKQRIDTINKRPVRLKNVTVFVWEWTGEASEHWAGFGGERLTLPNYLGAEVEKPCDIGCHYIADRRRIGEVDGVIMETPLPHYDHWAHEGLDLPQKRPHQKWFLLSYETPVYFPAQVEPEFQRLIDYNMTYDQTSEAAITMTCSWGGGVLQDFLRPPPPKAKHLAPVAFMATNCGAGGAEARGDYVRELMKYVAVDSYGGCLHNKDLPQEMQFAIYDDHGTSMKNKIKIFRFPLLLSFTYPLFSLFFPFFSFFFFSFLFSFFFFLILHLSSSSFFLANSHDAVGFFQSIQVCIGI
jgi:hypothetical protein